MFHSPPAVWWSLWLLAWWKRRSRRGGRATQSCHCLRVSCSRATWSATACARDRATERDRLRATQRGGGGSCREKWSGAAIPRHPGNQRSFKEKRPMANTGNCVQTKSHMTAKTPLPMHRVRREEGKKKRSWGVDGDREGKNKEQQRKRSEVKRF